MSQCRWHHLSKFSRITIFGELLPLLSKYILIYIETSLLLCDYYWKYDQTSTDYFLSPKKEYYLTTDGGKKATHSNKQIIFLFNIFFITSLVDVVISDLNADLARGLVCNDTSVIHPYRDRSDMDFLLSSRAEDCAEVYLKGSNRSGIYEIWPREGKIWWPCLSFSSLFWVGKPFKVLCDMVTDGGGWTVFQKRDDVAPYEDFYRTWLEYKRGFGNLQREQFWLGNDRISMLTHQDVYRLRVDLEDFDGQTRFAEYMSFRIASELDKYRLALGPFLRGDAGDSLTAHNGHKFSTKDQDNDISAISCAQVRNGAWWYFTCSDSNLNGGYLRGQKLSDNTAVVAWSSWRGMSYSLKRTEMKIRPTWFKPWFTPQHGQALRNFNRYGISIVTEFRHLCWRFLV